MTLGATMHGVILGTAAYMSPEQARGANADRRADVWAFGVVLWEMVTGRTLFAGPTVSDTLASVLKEKPDLAQLPAATPPRIRRLLERCLRKDAAQRLHSISDARIVLEEVQRGEIDEPGAASGVASAPARPRWQIAGALALAVFAGAALAFVAGRLMKPAPAPTRVLRFEIPQPAEIVTMGAPKVSPDGRHIAFGGRDKSGEARVWLRSLDSPEARALPGTENLNMRGRPFWSPDSRYVALFTADKLLKVPIDGGPAQKICDCTGADGSWSERGQILFDGTAMTPITGVSAGGGTAQPVIAAGGTEKGQNFGWPQFLPGGDRFLYVVLEGGDDMRGIWMAKADGSDRRRVAAGISRAEYVPPGWLLFVRESTLVAQRFDATSGKVSGDAIPIEDGLTLSNIGLAEFSVSRDGVLALRTGAAPTELFGTFDLKGERDAATFESGYLGHPVFSPDGRWLAFDQTTGQGANTDIWLRDLKRGVSSRFTTSPDEEFGPLFTPDGERIVFARVTGGKTSIVSRPVAVGEEVVLTTVDGIAAPVAISPDGRTLLFAAPTENQSYDLLALDLANGNRVTPITRTPTFMELRAAFSPDGRWLAVQSNDSGRDEIYVQPFPGPGRRIQLSTAGGSYPVWGRDGREIFFHNAAREWCRVPVEAGADFDAGVPEALFPITFGAGIAVRKIVLTPDNQHFLAEIPVATETAAPTNIIVGWDSALPR